MNYVTISEKNNKVGMIPRNVTIEKSIQVLLVSQEKMKNLLCYRLRKSIKRYENFKDPGPTVTESRSELNTSLIKDCVQGGTVHLRKVKRKQDLCE